MIVASGSHPVADHPESPVGWEVHVVTSERYPKVDPSLGSYTKVTVVRKEALITPLDGFPPGDERPWSQQLYEETSGSLEGLFVTHWMNIVPDEYMIPMLREEGSTRINATLAAAEAVSFVNPELGSPYHITIPEWYAGLQNWPQTYSQDFLPTVVRTDQLSNVDETYDLNAEDPYDYPPDYPILLGDPRYLPRVLKLELETTNAQNPYLAVSSLRSPPFPDRTDYVDLLAFQFLVGAFGGTVELERPAELAADLPWPSRGRVVAAHDMPNRVVVSTWGYEPNVAVVFTLPDEFAVPVGVGRTQGLVQFPWLRDGSASLEFSGSPVRLGDLEPPLRLTQRNDGLGGARHPRLLSTNANPPSSTQRQAAPRLGTNNRYR